MPSNKKVPAIVEQRRAARKAEKAAKVKQKAAEKPTRLPIDPAKTYTRDSINAEIGLGNVWFREAVKKGLPVQPAGRFKFVTGKDLIDFINSGKGASVTPRSKSSESN